MSVASTDRCNRSMRALLCLGDNSPFTETIWRGSWAVGTSSIISDTFGRVAHPPLKATMKTNRKKKKKGPALFMVDFIVRFQIVLDKSGLKRREAFSTHMNGPL